MRRSDEESKLLEHIKAQRANLKSLLAESSGHWGYEDPVYRFYHHSFKVFALQNQTDRIVSTLRGLLADRPLNASFLEIVKSGTGKKFSPDMNADWPRHARPILEAFFH